MTFKYLNHTLEIKSIGSGTGRITIIKGTNPIGDNTPWIKIEGAIIVIPTGPDTIEELKNLFRHYSRPQLQRLWPIPLSNSTHSKIKKFLMSA